ncbi:MAG TPA: pyridoxal-phosphate dependent enzyme, partial [Candidatus Saccharimonadales bacterium]|nr:pyridoxal-phosphate dependent enzyme [Candidatus Saccharimonadales bacterium]
ATREPGTLTFAISKQNVDEIVLVSEDEIKKAVFNVIKECHLVVEPSAAAAVAALIKFKPRKNNENIVVVISGGNISRKILADVLTKNA